MDEKTQETPVKPELLKATADKVMAVGRRKESSARVQLYRGTGLIQINKRDDSKFFGRATLRMIVRQPLEAAQLADKVNIIANVHGGGVSGQAGAVRHAISRALIKFDPSLKPILRKEDFLTRDPRMKERKKYGRKGARRRFQFSKR